VHRLPRRLFTALAAFTIAGVPNAGSSAPSFGTMAEIYEALRSADFAIVTAYVLPEHGGMTAALATMCRSHRRVDVELPTRTYLVGESVQNTVDGASATLQAAGCKVVRVDQPLHMKLAYVGNGSGGVPYLLDENFGASASVLRIDDPSDRDLIAQTLRGQPGSNGVLATRKDQALTLEAQAMDHSHGTLGLETESFGINNPVFDALVRAINQHRSILLLVASCEAQNSRERRLLDQLRVVPGVEVRTGESNAKIMLGGDDTAWFGSTNASSIEAEYAGQVDWGRLITDRAMRVELARRFISNWKAAAEPRYASTQHGC
jgi:hypothetical protein